MKLTLANYWLNNYISNCALLSKMSYALIINDKHNNIDCFVKDGGVVRVGWGYRDFDVWEYDDDFHTTLWRR